MKKLLFILLIPCGCIGQKPPKVMAQANSVVTVLPSDTLKGLGCDPNCQLINSWQWIKTAGPGTPVMSGQASNTLVLSGLQTGSYIYQLTVKNTAGLSASDTIGFSVKLPVIPSPPVVIHDTIIITKTVPVHDTLKIQVPYPVHDTIKINVPYPVHDTVKITIPCPVCPPVTICPVCPPIPKQRSVIGINIDAISGKITFTYDDGSK